MCAFFLAPIATRKLYQQISGTGDENSIDFQTARMARLADVSYKSGSERDRAIRDLHLQNTMYSNDENAVLLNPQDGKIYVSIRGTDTWGDVGTDSLLAIGKQDLTARYARENALIQTLIEKYGAQNIVLTGHSLGGSIADDLHQKYDIASYEFNPGLSNNGLLNSKKISNHQIYYASDDPIATLSRLSNAETHSYDFSTWNSHSLSNFTSTASPNIRFDAEIS